MSAVAATPQSAIRANSRLAQPTPSTSVKQLIHTIEAHNTHVSKPAQAAHHIGIDNTVTVCVRMRPLNTVERQTGQSIAWSMAGNSITHTAHTPAAAVPTTPAKKAAQSYNYDCIFDQHVTNDDIYPVIGVPTVERILQGYHSCVFAYGQTSSGKTHTISGSGGDSGLLSRMVYDLFDSIQSDAEHEFIIRVSYVEVYNEIINDLLEANSTNLDIHERDIKTTRNGKTVKIKQVYVDGLKEVVVNNPQSVLELVSAGESRRKTGKTNYNERSSRSHSIFRLAIESNSKSQSKQDSTRYSVLNLIDLAGSENICNVGSTARASETGFINKSLLTLSTVITKLAVNSQKKNGSATDTHLPFRDSKLTRMLQNSLNGESLVTVIATISPATSNVDQSISTLRFAANAKQVKQQVSINEISDETALLRQYRIQIDQLKTELQRKEELIGSLRTSTGNNVGESASERSALTEKIEQLESLIITSNTIASSNMLHKSTAAQPINTTPGMKHKRLRSISITNEKAATPLNDITNGMASPVSNSKVDITVSNETLQALCNTSKEDIILRLLSSENECGQLKTSVQTLTTEMQQWKDYCTQQNNQLTALQSKVNEVIKPLLQMLNKNKQVRERSSDDDGGLLDTDDFDSSLIQVDELFNQLSTTAQPSHVYN